MLRALLLSLFASLAQSFSCLDEKGNAVDYWVILKEPKGTTYLYYDTESPLAVSPNSLNDTGNGALTFTTKQLWASGIDTYALYNDDPPGNDPYNYAYGHTKGYFAIDTNMNGFYITHSIPNYPVGPSNSSKYLGLGGNAYTYAQDLMCLSVNASTIDTMSYKFLLNRPQIYDSLISSYVSATFGNITNLLAAKYSTAAICADQSLETSGGKTFTLFAKSGQWGYDLYDSCVSPRLQTDLWVETWLRGSKEGAYCPISGFKTLDVKDVRFSENAAWTETNDHSKWAVGLNQSIVCMGDINRMTTQYTRGGGTACIQDTVLFTDMKNAVQNTDTCK